MTDDMLSAAAAYALKGWRVLPLYWITSDGTCSCKRTDCKPGKHPRITGWPALASNVGADVWEWWQHTATANIGIATGRESGIWALDIDPDNGGDVTLAELVAEHGPLPGTRTHRTGSGGTHYVFTTPSDFSVPRIASTLFGKGIDTLGEDSFIVAPPSVSGKGAYTVTDEREPVAAPEWLLRPLREQAAHKAAVTAAEVVDGEPVDLAAVPAKLAALLIEHKPEDRSEHFWKIVSEARCGYTQGQVVTLVAPWCKASGKYTGRVEKQVAACWGKLEAKDAALRLPAAAITAGRHRAAGPAADKPERVTVQAGDLNPVDIADEVAAHLLAGNDPPQLFSMGTSAVALKAGKLEPLDPDRWLDYVARRVNFRIVSRGTTRIVQPPAGAMKLIPLAVLPGLPVLDGIKATPYLDAAGNLVASDGYHPGTRLLLHTGGLQLGHITEAPGAEEVAQAVKLLTEDWLGDFPFATVADVANVLAVLLTLTGRMFFGLSPLFIIDASTPGSGKGLLVITISLIAAGEAPHLMELPADGEEQRKKITSALLAGQELITWDESHIIQGRSLAMILTAEKYSDRLLGGNKMIHVVNSFTQVALGNNVQVWGDMKRRVVPARLVPDTAHPEHRTDFRHTDLEGWVRANRGDLLAAVLTIWRNWIACGRPKANVTMGSFERWARTVGGALQAAGIEGFLSNTSQWLDTSDEDAAEWQEHLVALTVVFGGTQFSANDVVGAVQTGKIALPWFKRDAEMPLSKALGYRYRNIRDRWLGDLRLVSPGMSNGRTRWRVEARASESMSTDLTMSTAGDNKPDTPSRDGDIGRDQSGGSKFGWPADSIGEEANQ